MRHKIYLYNNKDRVIIIGESSYSGNNLLLFLDKCSKHGLHDNGGIFSKTCDKRFLHLDIEEIFKLIKLSSNSGYRYFYYSNNITPTDCYIDTNEKSAYNKLSNL